MTAVQRVPVQHRGYPPWAVERLSQGQATGLPPAIVWAKVLERTRAASACAVNVGLGIYFEVSADGASRPVSVRGLARRLRRSQDYTFKGTAELDALGFVEVCGQGKGRAASYALTLPTDDPDRTEQQSGSGAKAHRTAEHSRDEPREVHRLAERHRTGGQGATAPSTGAHRTASPGTETVESEQTAKTGAGVDAREKILTALIEAAPAPKRSQIERRCHDIRQALGKLDGGPLSPGRIVQTLTERELDSAADAGAVILKRIDDLSRDRPARLLDDVQRRLAQAQTLGANYASLDERAVRSSLEARYPDVPDAVLAGMNAWRQAQRQKVAR